jgi:hypothetical protein
MSVFMGHTHAQRVHHKTKHRGREIERELVGIECGTMRRSAAAAGSR